MSSAVDSPASLAQLALLLGASCEEGRVRAAAEDGDAYKRVTPDQVRGEMEDFAVAVNAASAPLEESVKSAFSLLNARLDSMAAALESAATERRELAAQLATKRKTSETALETAAKERKELATALETAETERKGLASQLATERKSSETALETAATERKRLASQIAAATKERKDLYIRLANEQGMRVFYTALDKFVEWSVDHVHGLVKKGATFASLHKQVESSVRLSRAACASGPTQWNAFLCDLKTKTKEDVFCTWVKPQTFRDVGKKAVVTILRRVIVMALGVESWGQIQNMWNGWKGDRSMRTAFVHGAELSPKSFAQLLLMFDWTRSRGSRPNRVHFGGIDARTVFTSIGKTVLFNGAERHEFDSALKKFMPAPEETPKKRGRPDGRGRGSRKRRRR